MEDAAQDVRDKVSRVRGRLPDDIEEPVIAKQEADAQPFMWLALTGENYDLLQLSDLADRLVKTRLQSLPGVGRIFIGGERRYSMRVWLDRLGARGALAHGAGRRGGDPQSQRRDPCRPDRIGSPRVHRALPRRAEDAGGVQPVGGLQRQRPDRQAGGSRPGGAGSGGRSERTPLPRQPVGGRRHRAPVEVESGQGGGRRARGLAGARAGAASRRQDHLHLRSVHLRQALHPGGARTRSSSRRSSSWSSSSSSCATSARRSSRPSPSRLRSSRRSP